MALVESTLDILNVNSYHVEIDRIRNFNYMCKTIDTPSISLNAVSVSTPFQRMAVPGDTVELGTFSMSLMVDENLYNYNSILYWMTQLGFPNSHDDFKSMLVGGETERSKKSYTARETSDITIHLLTNHRNSNRILKLYNAFPISLSGINLNNDNSDSEPVMAQIEFEFTGMQFMV
jgi:hypothetical protein